MFEKEGSPYKDKTTITIEEFLWAFTIVSSRHVVLNNENISLSQDPKMLLLIMPLFDLFNHSITPNVVALPYQDKL